MNIFSWKYKPLGNCPIQAKGVFIGHEFYFRSRYNEATIEFYDKKDSSILVNEYVIHTTANRYSAGWLPKWVCQLLIYKGCIMFLFKFKSNN
jgi:hypothetical protein